MISIYVFCAVLLALAAVIMWLIADNLRLRSRLDALRKIAARYSSFSMEMWK